MNERRPSAMTRWVYILASRRNGALYIGTTGDLACCVRRHRAGNGAGPARRSRATRLVYAQALETAALARARKRRLEKWPRHWTLRLIDRHNPGWRDLYGELEG